MTAAHRDWLASLRFEDLPSEATFQDYLHAHDVLVCRRDRLDEHIERLAASCSFATEVARLRCMRGIDTLSAMGLCAEARGVARFARPIQVSAFLGLVPSEDTSGEHRRQGSITKAGSVHARRLMVEAAWHYRKPPRLGGDLRSPPARRDPASVDCAGAPSDACTSAGATSTDPRQARRPSPRSPSPASSRTSAGRSPDLTPPTTRPGCRGWPPRRHTMADDCAVSTPPRGALDLRQSASDEQRSCGTEPANISQIVVAQRRPAPRTPTRTPHHDPLAEHHQTCPLTNTAPYPGTRNRIWLIRPRFCSRNSDSYCGRTTFSTGVISFFSHLGRAGRSSPLPAGAP